MNLCGLSFEKRQAELGKSRLMTLEAWEQIAILARGELNAENGSSATGESVRRQPDISEVASRLQGAVNGRR